MKENIEVLKNRERNFIKNSSLLYDNKYDYSKVVYVNYLSKVTIICPKHGEFIQSPKGHSMGRGCWKCGREQATISTALTVAKRVKPVKEIKDVNSIKELNLLCRYKKFISSSVFRYGSKYKYDKVKYVSAIKPVVITCNIHGDFLQTPHDHLRKNGNGGCKICAQNIINSKITNTNTEFIAKSQEKHQDKFTYYKCKYVNQFTPITITCKIHGDFSIIPKEHIRGKGCPKCVNVAGYGWKRSDFISRAKGKNATLYVLKCTNEYETFYKVGITIRNIKDRFDSKFRMPYNYTVVYSYIGNPEVVWNTEKEYHKILNKYIYTPKLNFGGSVKECFTDISGIEHLCKNLTDGK